jgi:hypothetical protein
MINKRLILLKIASCGQRDMRETVMHFTFKYKDGDYKLMGVHKRAMVVITSVF